MHGWIAYHKEAGALSTQVVNRVRRLTGAAKAGHGGTLDPFAEGLLPMALGEATKALGMVLEGDKAYRAWVALGSETDSGDLTGQVIQSGGEIPDAAAVAAALAGFVGEIDQVPPSHSALWVDGQRAYDRVRRGEEVILPARKVRVDQLTLLGYDQGVAEIDVRCGKGTYVRALARDLGRCLGCGGHLRRLLRTETMGFTLADAVDYATLSMAVAAGRLATLVFPPDRVLADIPVLRLDVESWRKIGNGQRVAVPGSGERAGAGMIIPSPGPVRLLTPEGRFVGLGVVETTPGGCTIHPKRLFLIP